MGESAVVEIIFGKIGFGVGDGFGDGGYGDGSGYGSGGYGFGDGDGSGFYWKSCLAYFTEKLPTNQRDRLSAAQAEGLPIAYWRSDQSGKPVNGGRGVVGTPGAIHEEKGPLNLCAPGTLHATLIPTKWQGDRWWIVALHGEVIGDDEKFGCLKREIIGECI